MVQVSANRKNSDGRRPRYFTSKDTFNINVKRPSRDLLLSTSLFEIKEQKELMQSKKSDGEKNSSASESKLVEEDSQEEAESSKKSDNEI